MKPGRIRLLACDVDGVLTDGRISYGEAGEPLKSFHVRDGLGLRQLAERGIEVALITGRRDPAVVRRAEELGIRHLRMGAGDKRAALDEIMTALGVKREEAAYVGDDVPDLPVFAAVGLAVAVADAHPSVRARAHWVTQAKGGRGAIREVADRLLEGDAFRVVIPARFGSTRLPGKPLRLIDGKPMIAHVLERAREAGATEVVVATDDERIREAVAALGGRALMTSPEHPSGTDRLAEVIAREGWGEEEVVVNLQGDEPLMPGEAIRRAAEALWARPQAGIATLAAPLEEKDLPDPNVVKVVLDDAGMARWFSRAPLPCSFRHLGLYAYRAGVVLRLSREAPRPAERAERLEQLRALAVGVGIFVTVLDKLPAPGVDTEADLARVEAWLKPRKAP